MFMSSRSRRRLLLPMAVAAAVVLTLVLLLVAASRAEEAGAHCVVPLNGGDCPAREALGREATVGAPTVRVRSTA